MAKKKVNKRNTKDSRVRDYSHRLDADDVNDAPDKKPSMMARLSTRLKSNSHRKIERMSRSIIISASLILVGGGYSIYHNHVKQSEQSKQATPFGYKLSFSQTGAEFTTGVPYRSADNKTLYIPVKFSDLTYLSSDAESYGLLIDTTAEYFEYQPSAQLLMFGETGNAVIILQGAPQFTSQMLTIYIRNDKNLTGNLPKQTGKAYDEYAAIQAQFDIARFNVNPGAKNVYKIDGIDGDNLDPILLYQKIFAESRVTAIHEKVAETKRGWRIKQAQLDEYRERLVRMGYTVPEDPIYMNEGWRSAASENVRLENTLEEGFANTGGLDKVVNKAVESLKEEKEKMAAEQAAQREGVTEQDSGALTYDTSKAVELTDDELLPLDDVELPDALQRDDGTMSNDEVNMSEADSTNGQVTWTAMKAIYAQVLREKQEMYTTTARELLDIERDVNRQDKSATIGTAKNLTLLTNVGAK